MVMRTDVGFTLVLREVWHILEVCQNLVSILALDKAGYWSNFGHGKWKLSGGSSVIEEEFSLSKLLVGPLVSRSRSNPFNPDG